MDRGGHVRAGTGDTADTLSEVVSARTHYAKCGDSDIAYQVLGKGPIDLLLFTGLIVPVDCMDEEPSLARFQRRLASFADSSGSTNKEWDYRTGVHPRHPRRLRIG